jgi:hypothetical protein
MKKKFIDQIKLYCLFLIKIRYYTIDFVFVDIHGHLHTHDEKKMKTGRPYFLTVSMLSRPINNGLGKRNSYKAVLTSYSNTRTEDSVRIVTI